MSLRLSAYQAGKVQVVFEAACEAWSPFRWQERGELYQAEVFRSKSLLVIQWVE